MKLIKPSIEFLNMTDSPLETIERAGRTCYKSEDKITENSAKIFVQKLLDRGHLAMIEHAWASYRVTTDRGVTHEIVRHRLFSYAQESTRFCDYKDRHIQFIMPLWLETSSSFSNQCWRRFIAHTERIYKELRSEGWSPQMARSVLPNSLKTEIVITGNLREWRHFFQLRTAKSAHPQMQEIANMMLVDIRSRISIIFDDMH